MNLLKKIAAITVATTILTITTITASAAEYIGIGTIKGSVVNVREGAGTHHKVIATAYAGGKLKAVEQLKGWTKVELADGKVGYVSSEYIKVETSKGQKGFVTGSVVNVREGAGVDYKVIGSVTYGQSVDVTGSENGWFSIAYNGVKGYVCGEYVSFEELTDASNKSATDKVLSEAKNHLGKPYVYGANGPYSFDCSGFTSYVFRQLGYNLNRTAAGQYSNGVYVSKDQLKPGDLVMFGRGNISHVGIYIGDNKFIHAENSRTGVVITSMSASYYASTYVGARRIV